MFDLTPLFATLQTTLQGWAEDAIALLPSLVAALLVLAVARFAARWAGRLVTHLVGSMSDNAPFSELAGTVVRIAVLAVAVFVALGLLKLDKTVTSLLAGVGVIGLALGFAFQDIAANFMSGFLMALRRPFARGDLVEVGGHRGRIVDISLRSTEIETLDGLSTLIPNKDVFQSAIVNYTRTATRRLDVSVGTAYGDDMARVREVVLDAVDAVPDRDTSRAPELYFESFGDSSINFSVRVWLSKSDERTYLHARSEAMLLVKKALDDASLTIPFPIRTLDFGAKVVGGTALHEAPLRIARSG